MRARHSGEVDAKFVLPDGQSILLGEPRFACPEVMFQPALEDLKCPSIVDVICQTIEKCDFDYKLDFYGNIVMSGGSSMFRGNNDCRSKAYLIIYTSKYVMFLDLTQLSTFSSTLRMTYSVNEA